MHACVGGQHDGWARSGFHLPAAPRAPLQTGLSGYLCTPCSVPFLASCISRVIICLKSVDITVVSVVYMLKSTFINQNIFEVKWILCDIFKFIWPAWFSSSIWSLYMLWIWKTLWFMDVFFFNFYNVIDGPFLTFWMILIMMYLNFFFRLVMCQSSTPFEVI